MMKLLVLIISLTFVACGSNPHKAKDIETNLEKTQDSGGGRTLGINDKGEMVTQKKVEMADYLKRLQWEVYEQEEEIYGSEQTGRKGKWGVLEDCLIKANSLKLGGEGTYAEMPPKARLTLKENKLTKMGVDENKNLVGVSEDYLQDRINRFENYKTVYGERKEWYDLQIKNCKLSVEKKKQLAPSSPYPEIAEPKQ